MSRFRFTPGPLSGLVCVDRVGLADHRGFLARLYCADEFAAAGIARPIAQINHTQTRRRGAVRGMHFQRSPHAEAKLVSCIRGQVFDVAVDLRAGSTTFLQWHGEILSQDNGRALFIPPGFAHGFQTCTDGCELVYLHSAPYRPESEGAVHAFDARLAIAWPLPVVDLSARDQAHPFLPMDYPGIAS